ncbi:MAG: FKBP-type peptidyl-prolyl cis-trans isomerase [Deltaproteobacteria bacterium]|nr:FKBP-type peptidyl-prolyl cis-trans isomerase [Deltaproteobacteria bacterium]
MKRIFLTLIFVLSFVSVVSAQLPLINLDGSLKYKDLKVGKGEEALSGKVLVVDYSGWILKSNGNRGVKFDSSYDAGRRFEFRLGAGDVIKGWDEGVVGMHVGGIRELRIPSKLAYGSQSIGKKIPPSSNLIFEIELLEVK